MHAVHSRVPALPKNSPILVILLIQDSTVLFLYWLGVASKIGFSMVTKQQWSAVSTRTEGSDSMFMGCVEIVDIKKKPQPDESEVSVQQKY